MSYKKIREILIKIPIIEKVGTLRRNLLHPQKAKAWSIDMEQIRQVYSKGEKNKRRIPFFIVYSNQPQGGLFVYLMDCMAQIAYAVQQGYVPVVDMLNFPNNLRNESQKEINAWELYFQQPMGISVPEVYGAEEIHFHNDVAEKMLYIGDVEAEQACQEYEIVIDERKPYDAWLSNQEYMLRFKRFWQTYMHYSDEAQKYIDEKYQRLFEGKKKTLGLLCRGTDYLSLKPKGHYVQPTREMIVEKVQCVMKETECDSIFLATEDRDIYEYIKGCFGDKVIALDAERVKYKEGYLLKDLYQKQNMNIYKRQLDYLTEMELLARCQCLIAGKTTGSRFLPVMKKENYEYLLYWELGRYE